MVSDGFLGMMMMMMTMMMLSTTMGLNREGLIRPKQYLLPTQQSKAECLSCLSVLEQWQHLHLPRPRFATNVVTTFGTLRSVSVAQWARPVNRPQYLLAWWAEESLPPVFKSRFVREFFRLDWTSRHTMRLNSRTGTEGLPVCSLNCDRPLYSG